MGEELGWRLAFQGLVRAVVMVVGEVGLELLVTVAAIGGRIQVHALPFNGALEAFDESVVGSPAAAITADVAAGGQ